MYSTLLVFQYFPVSVCSDTSHHPVLAASKENVMAFTQSSFLASMHKDDSSVVMTEYANPDFSSYSSKISKL